MRKNRSNRRASHHRNRRYHKTQRRHRGGNNGVLTSVTPSSLYKPVASVAREPILIADKVGKNVSDTIKQAQVSLLQGQYKAKEQGKKVGDAIKGFGQSITDTISSWFGGGGSRRRHHKRSSKYSRRNLRSIKSRY